MMVCCKVRNCTTVCKGSILRKLQGVGIGLTQARKPRGSMRVANDKTVAVETVEVSHVEEDGEGLGLEASSHGRLRKKKSNAT